MSLVGVYYENQRSSDDPAYFISLEQARQLRREGQGFSINHGTAIRLLAPKPTDTENTLAGGTMRDAWQIRESAGYLVMQLRTERGINCES